MYEWVARAALKLNSFHFPMQIQNKVNKQIENFNLISLTPAQLQRKRNQQQESIMLRKKKVNNVDEGKGERVARKQRTKRRKRKSFN